MIIKRPSGLRRRIAAVASALGLGAAIVLTGATPASAASSNISGPNTITYNRAFFQCNNTVGYGGYIGDVTYQSENGRYVSYLRQYHILQKWNGSAWVTKTWRYWNKANPWNGTRYYAPSQYRFDTWYPVGSYGPGYYRIQDYFQWFWGSNLRATRTLNTPYCYLS